MVMTTNFAFKRPNIWFNGNEYSCLNLINVFLCLDEFCYRFNRRFWEDHLFDRLLTACTNCESTTYAELTQ